MCTLYNKSGGAPLTRSLLYAYVQPFFFLKRQIDSLDNCYDIVSTTFQYMSCERLARNKEASNMRLSPPRILNIRDTRTSRDDVSLPPPAAAADSI